MSGTTERTRADFDRLAALDEGRWDHNLHYHGFLLRSLPSARGMALEVGCGTGAFARALAPEFERVMGIDLSLEMIRRARERSRDVGNVEFREADVAAYDLPVGAFDCVATIATLHHLPMEATLAKLRTALRPGGVLLVLDLYQPRTLADWMWSTAAVPAALLLRGWKLRRLREPAAMRQAWAEHGQHDVYPTLAEVRAVAERLLAGATVRRHLFWRYSLVWRKPA